MSTFMELGETGAEVKTTLKDDFQIDSGESLELRVQVARLLAAWDAARIQVAKEEAAKADARASQVDRPAATMEHIFMRTSFEKIYGKLLSGELPSRQCIGRKVVDVEEDEVKAERLNEVSAVSDVQEDFLITTLDSDGSVKIKKGIRDSSLPKTPEQLRAKLRLMGNMWCFLFLRYRKAWLADVTPEVFRRYADYLLGERVYSMPFPESGQFMLPWNLLITYELEIRREVCRKINDEGLTMASALPLARAVTPICVMCT